MKTKRFVGIGVASAAILSLGLAGCAPAGSGTGNEAGAESDGKITVWTSVTGVVLEEMQAYAKTFESEFGAPVEIVNADDNAIKQKVQAAAASGDFPDIVQYYGGSFMQPLIDANAFLPLDDYIAESSEWNDQMASSWAENFTFDGSTYAVPYEAPLVQLFFNTAILAEVGLEGAPETFDDLLSYVSTLKAAGYTPIAVDGADGWPLQQYFAYLVMRNGGTDAVYDAVAGDLAWDSDVFKKSAEQLMQLIDAGAFADGFLGENYDQMLTRYTSGDAAMILNGSWLLNSFISADNTELINQTDFSTFPTVQGGVGLATDVQGGPNASLAIARLSPDADLSWEFIKGFTSNEVATTIAVKSLSLVPNIIDISGEDVPKIFSKLVNDLPTYTGFNIFWNEILSPELNTEFTNLQNSMAAGQISPEEMVTKLAEFAESN